MTYMFILKCALKLVLKISYTMMHGRKNIKRTYVEMHTAQGVHLNMKISCGITEQRVNVVPTST